MKLTDKLLFAIAMLLFVLFAVGNFVGAVNSAVFVSFARYFHLYDKTGGFLAFIADTVISAGLICMVVRLCAAVFGKSMYGTEDIHDKCFAVTSRDNPDEVHVYIVSETIEQIARRCALSHRSVEDCKARLLSVDGDNAVSIRISVVPATGSDIPTLATDVKKSVAEAVSSQSGISVHDVEVIVFPSANKRMKSSIN